MKVECSNTWGRTHEYNGVGSYWCDTEGADGILAREWDTMRLTVAGSTYQASNEHREEIHC